jgi:hypothetical protein
MTNKQPCALSLLSQRVGKVLRAFGETRARHRMTADEVLIFLALGHLGLVPNSHGVALRPITCLDLADILNIPKETVRRKVARLAELELVETTTRGAIIQNHEEWRRLAEAIAVAPGT